MTVTAKCLYEAAQLPAVQTTIYTANGVRTILDKVTATNVSGSAVNVTINIVPSGGSAGSANILTQTKAVQAAETYGFPELIGHILNAGDFVSVLASAATSVNFRMSGREVS